MPLPSCSKVSVPAIELNVVEHCNLRCKNCDHSSPLLPPRILSPQECSEVLSALDMSLHARELKIIGGEPLLHPDLTSVLSACRDSGISDQITLWTNGLLLSSISKQACSIIDGIIVSIYPGIQHPYEWSDIQSVLDAHSVWLHKRHCHKFMKSNLIKPIKNESLIQHIFNTCSEARYNQCHTVRNGRYFKCVQAAYATSRLAASNIEFNNDKDGISIYRNSSLGGDLISYLADNHPLLACRYCIGDLGRWLPHKQLSVSDENQCEETLCGCLSDDCMLPFSLLQDDLEDE